MSSKVRRSRLDHPLVDADGERHGEDAGGGVHQQADGLEGVSQQSLRRGAGDASALRFLSPLVKRSMRVSRTALSDWLHLATVGIGPR